MKLAIMQPYFLPYIGYYQLISSVDVFVIYDNIKYTKKGWINRNRMLLNGEDTVFSIPLKKGSDALRVDQRWLAHSFDREKLLGQFDGAYRKSPFFKDVFPLLEDIIRCRDDNLFNYLYYSLCKTCTYLGIDTKILISSEVPINHSLKAQDKVLDFCRVLNAREYINTMGGKGLYDQEAFLENGINLSFIKSKPLEYKQFEADFVAWLSIVDVLMFNPLDVVRENVCTNYELV